ncbi:MAG: efflux RND transporter permease subunit [Bdellovibrionales bacterium]|nr:efflux RND transporter permease subunit [Bdellovibrionales bacterium]
MNSVVKYFASRPLIANVMLFGLIALAIAMWGEIGKEERPEFALNWMRVTLPYPGASAQDIELFVIKPVEEQFKSISGLYEINSSATFGSANFSITVDPNIKNFAEKAQEIKDAVDRAELPLEVEDPIYDKYNSSEKAIIDIAFYLEGVELLDTKSRQRLQEYALTFKNQLISLPHISGVEQKAYLKPELQIKVNPQKLVDYEVSMSEVADRIKQQHIRTPVGVMEDPAESEVSLTSYLDNVEDLENTVIRNNFQGQKIYLNQIAKVQEGFERTTSIRKIQGHEAVVFNAQKSSGYGILDARSAIFKLVSDFRRTHEGSNIRIQLLDDESYDVRNRLSIIATNGLVGFLIILIILFLFLNFQAGFWVAMGLPFALAFTLIACFLAGYTVNNITLAAIIIVLGIVVDDAIIVADSIAQSLKEGKKDLEAATHGTVTVIKPILASILTTCAAFIPLLFFTGRFGLFIKYMPFVVIVMLFASLIESFLILPSHMITPMPGSKKVNKSKFISKINNYRTQVLGLLEKRYKSLLTKVLVYRKSSLIFFLIIIFSSAWIVYSKLNFVMFPREESKEFAVKVIAPEKTSRSEMADLVKKVEKLFLDDKFNSVVGFRTVVGESRRGGQVRENEANLRIELLPPSEQKAPFNEMIDYWKHETKKMPEFKEVRFMESWWSSDSGSPIALEVRENNDKKRQMVSEAIKAELEKIESLENVEIERPLVKTEYALDLDLSETIRLGINPANLATSMRAYIQGQILYRVNNGEEEVDVRLTSEVDNKDDITKVLQLRANNSEGYLVPISQLVKVNKEQKPISISRVNYKRANMIYADLKQDSKKTPLEIAQYLEEQIFPKIIKQSPTTVLKFRGEIQDSRESGSDFALSVTLILTLIYVLMVFLFGSLTTPLVIATAIPFGVVGVVLAFWSHGFDTYGFFAVIGTLGMLGVVINDSIVLVDKFENHFKNSFDKNTYIKDITKIAITRLRPVILTTLTTVAGVFPTAYGLGGYDAMLADMMLAMGWGLIFGTSITLLIVPILYSFLISFRYKAKELMQ